MNTKYTQHKHFALYKPYGYLSQFVNNQTKRKNKKLLGELYDFPKGTMAIGRLDEKSEGLLLLTTNGKTSEYIRSNKVAKEYYVQVDGIPTNKDLEILRNGVEISTNEGLYTTKNCIVDFLKETPNFPERSKKVRDDRHGPTTWIRIIICEGKFRQIRKMTAKIKFPTLRLVRIRIGNISLRNLKLGKVKMINL